MKADRLFQIIYYIIDNGRVTASELAERFEVSIRTIYRDIDTISSANIPIYANQGRYGGIEISKDFVLTKSLLTESEQKQILNALHTVDSTSNSTSPELLSKLSALFKAKYTNWIEVDFCNWHQDQKNNQIFENIKLSIFNKSIIRFTYYNSNGEAISRSVKPIRLVFKGQSWYLYAYCLLKNDFRFFKISRTKDLVIEESTYDDDFSSLVINKEIKPEPIDIVKVKFDKRIAFRVYDELTGPFVTDKNGDIYTEIPVVDKSYLMDYILSFKDTVEVLEPLEIRNEIIDTISKLSKKYIT